MQITPETIIGILAGLAGSALYAMAVIVYRSQSEGIRPVGISTLRLWVGFLFMAMIVILPLGIFPILIPLDTIAILILSIVLTAVVGDTLYFVSQERIGVSSAFPIAMSFPILTYILTVLFLGDPFYLSRMFGIILAVLGIIIISKEEPGTEPGTEDNPVFDTIGISLAVFVTILFASGTTLLQVGINEIDPISGNFVMMFFGAVLFVPIVGISFRQGMQKPTRNATKIIMIAGFFEMGLGYFLFVTSVKLVGAAVASIIGSLAPLFAVPVSIFYLKEKFTRLASIGVILIVIGVVFVVIGV